VQPALGGGAFSEQGWGWAAAFQAGQADIEAGVVGDVSTCSDEYYISARAFQMGVGAGSWAGDPAAGAVIQSEAAVQAEGEFKGDMGAVLVLAGEKAGHYCLGFSSSDARYDFDSSGLEFCDAFAIGAGVWVWGGDDGGFYAGFYQ